MSFASLVLLNRWLNNVATDHDVVSCCAAWPVARSIFDAPLGAMGEKRTSGQQVGEVIYKFRLEFINFLPGYLWLCNCRRKRRESCKACTTRALAARQPATTFKVQFDFAFRGEVYHARMTRHAQHLRCYVREANERTTSWIREK